MASIRVRLWRQVLGLKWVDTILKDRAARLLRTTGILNDFRDGGRYVDIGTGAGHIVERIIADTRGRDVRYVALDPVWRPTGRVLRRLRRRHAGRILFVRGDGLRLPLPDAAVDGVSLFFVLHHIPYDRQVLVLREVLRVLTPDGRLFLLEDTPETPTEWQVTVRRDRRLNFEGADEGHYYRSGGEWLRTLGECGMCVEREVYFEEHARSSNGDTTRHRCFVVRRSDTSDVANLSEVATLSPLS